MSLGDTTHCKSSQDLNVHLGYDRSWYTHDFEIRDDMRKTVLEFALVNDLALDNTFFKKLEEHFVFKNGNNRDPYRLFYDQEEDLDGRIVKSYRNSI